MGAVRRKQILDLDHKTLIAYKGEALNVRNRIIISVFALGMLASVATAPARAQDKMPDEKTAKDEMAGDKMNKKKPKKKSKAKANKMDKKEDGKM